MSRNPVTGASEIVVEAVLGFGDALVQGGITPQRWVNKWGVWLAKPDAETIPLKLIDQVVGETRLITQKLRSDVDLEWAYDGENLYWLQERDITTLNRHNVYSNHISKEMLPGIIKPLVETVNIPMVCATWIQFMNEFLGRTSVKPEELAKSFYYRVYFNMGTLGRLFKEVGLPAEFSRDNDKSSSPRSFPPIYEAHAKDNFTAAEHGRVCCLQIVFCQAHAQGVDFPAKGFELLSIPATRSPRRARADEGNRSALQNCAGNSILQHRRSDSYGYV